MWVTRRWSERSRDTRRVCPAILISRDNIARASKSKKRRSRLLGKITIICITRPRISSSTFFSSVISSTEIKEQTVLSSLFSVFSISLLMFHILHLHKWFFPWKEEQRGGKIRRWKNRIREDSNCGLIITKWNNRWEKESESHERGSRCRGKKDNEKKESICVFLAKRKQLLLFIAFQAWNLLNHHRKKE